MPVATAVDEEALLDDGDDASPPPQSQSDDALSALHAFLFGGPGARTADHWRAVGGVIASRGGVIAPEDLAPHLPAPPMKLRGSEAAAAVAVVHFRGRPRRCEEGGGVVFEFPELVGGAPADGDDALVDGAAEDPQRDHVASHQPRAAERSFKGEPREGHGRLDERVVAVGGGASNQLREFEDDAAALLAAPGPAPEVRHRDGRRGLAAAQFHGRRGQVRREVLGGYDPAAARDDSADV